MAEFNILPLEWLGGFMSRTGRLNRRREVVGWEEGLPVTRGFLWRQQRAHILSAEWGVMAKAIAINDQGVVVGYGDKPQGEMHPVERALRYYRGEMQELPMLVDVREHDGMQSRATGVNAAGQIVGESDTDWFPHACLWENGDLLDLGTLGGRSSSALDINDHGEVVGFSTEADENHEQGFHWSPERGMVKLPGLSDRSTAFAHAINENGVIVGSSNLPPGQTIDLPVMWVEGRIVELGTLGGDFGEAYGVNNAGWAVGFSRGPYEGYHAFLWRDGRIWDLNDLIAPGSGWVIREASDINDAGEIAASGTFHKSPRVCLLVPV